MMCMALGYSSNQAGLMAMEQYVYGQSRSEDTNVQFLESQRHQQPMQRCTNSEEMSIEQCPYHVSVAYFQPFIRWRGLEESTHHT